MKIRTIGDSIELKLIHSVVKTVRRKKIVEKEIAVPKWFPKDAIVTVESYLNEDNEIIKDRSIILDKYSGRFYSVWHSPEDILQVKYGQQTINPAGFKNGSHIQAGESPVRKSGRRRA